ncbi:hypothetical protein RI367_006023 [Sorochytrium milnesiophthora]
MQSMQTAQRSSLLPTRAAASPVGSRLCHVCGGSFPKASLPAHQRSCVRKSLRSIEPTSPAKASTADWESSGTFPCTHCMQHIPSNILQAHLRTCDGTKVGAMSGGPRRDLSQRSTSMSGIPAPGTFATSGGYRGAPAVDDLPDVQQMLAHHQQQVQNFQRRQSQQQQQHKSMPSLRQQAQDDDYEEATPMYKPQLQQQQQQQVRAQKPQRQPPARKQPPPPPPPPEDEYEDEEEQEQHEEQPSDALPTLRRQKPPAAERVLPSDRPAHYGFGPEEVADPDAEPSRSSADAYLKMAAAAEGDPAHAPAVSVDSRVPCQLCGRKFAPDAIERHTGICEKAASKKRNVFNMQQQRVQGTELVKFVKVPAKTGTIKGGVPPLRTRSAEGGDRWDQADDDAEEAPVVAKAKPKKKKKAPVQDEDDADDGEGNDKPAWKAKSEAFRASMKAARTGGPAAPSAPDPSLVQCPVCTRRFNEETANRHIPWCKEQKAKEDLKNGSRGGDKKATGDGALEKRTKYQPPLPGAKKKKAGEGGDPSKASPEKQPAGAKPRAASGKAAPSGSIFCGACGNRFPTTNAKFCFECGGRRG